MSKRKFQSREITTLWNKALWLDVAGHMTILANESAIFHSWEITTLWNKALWLDVAGHMTSLNQSEGLIS